VQRQCKPQAAPKPSTPASPVQYFQIETACAYNWHRHYDPISGRYTQPDPLRFIDGPSMYAYAGNSPWMYSDREGLGKIGFLIKSVRGGWKFATRSQAARELSKRGDVLAKGPANSGKAAKLAKDQFGNKTTRHDGHELGGGKTGRPHYQHKNGSTGGRRGHVFYSSPFIAFTYVCQYGDNWWTETLDFF
jgi:RHS repeat-associated protein